MTLGTSSPTRASPTRGASIADATLAPPNRRFTKVLALLLLAGLITAGCWVEMSLATIPTSAILPFNILGALCLCLVLTALSLIVRWFRLQFLFRRFTRLLGTRDSVSTYLATIPA